MKWDRQNVTIGQERLVEAQCPVIISASRATDIPAFYAPWMVERLEHGHIRWVNPFNANQSDYISFSKTRLFVFWSKHPNALIPHLNEWDTRGIQYYFQYSMNDYDTEGFEPNVPRLEKRVEVFKRLSDMIGPDRVIWRFDPLILTDKLGPQELLAKIDHVYQLLAGYTKKLVISFADIQDYSKVQRNLSKSGISFRDFSSEGMIEMASLLQEWNQGKSLEIATCAEAVDLASYGVKHNKCIDDDLMIRLFPHDRDLMDFIGFEGEDLFGERKTRKLKDKGQRKECGCIMSKDIGMYNTCNHLCVYCYANCSAQAVSNNLKKHDRHGDRLIP